MAKATTKTTKNTTTKAKPKMKIDFKKPLGALKVLSALTTLLPFAAGAGEIAEGQSAQTDTATATAQPSEAELFIQLYAGLDRYPIFLAHTVDTKPKSFIECYETVRSDKDKFAASAATLDTNPMYKKILRKFEKILGDFEDQYSYAQMLTGKAVLVQNIEVAGGRPGKDGKPVAGYNIEISKDKSGKFVVSYDDYLNFVPYNTPSGKFLEETIMAGHNQIKKFFVGTVIVTPLAILSVEQGGSVKLGISGNIEAILDASAHGINGLQDKLVETALERNEQGKIAKAEQAAAAKAAKAAKKQKGR